MTLNPQLSHTLVPSLEIRVDGSLFLRSKLIDHSIIQSLELFLKVANEGTKYVNLKEVLLGQLGNESFIILRDVLCISTFLPLNLPSLFSLIFIFWKLKSRLSEAVVSLVPCLLGQFCLLQDPRHPTRPARIPAVLVHTCVMNLLSVSWPLPVMLHHSRCFLPLSRPVRIHVEGLSLVRLLLPLPNWNDFVLAPL